MKSKFFLSAVIFCLFFSSVYAQPETSQIIIPKKLFVGDTAELRYSFQSSLELFEDNPEVDEKLLPLSELPFDFDNDDFSISKLILQRNGGFYTIIFTVTTWKTGLIDIPAFNLLPMTVKNYTVPLEINPEPFEVSSILTNGEETPLKTELGPLLVPGTIYMVWLFIIILILVLVIFVYLFIKRRQISDFIKRILLRLSYAWNARKALKELKKLELKGNSFDDKTFCASYQKIIRKYLNGRFGISFDSVSSRELPEAFERATGGFVSEDREEKIETLEGNFYRTDYIRYASGSLDSKRFPASKYQALLLEGERERLVNDAKAFIAAFETNKPKNGEKNA